VAGTLNFHATSLPAEPDLFFFSGRQSTREARGFWEGVAKCYSSSVVIGIKTTFAEHAVPRAQEVLSRIVGFLPSAQNRSLLVLHLCFED